MFRFMRGWHIKQIENKEYIFVNCKVANPLKPQKTEKIEFLVDTGASGCAISQELADKLELEPMGSVEAGLADGSFKRVKATYILIEVGGKKLYTWTIYDKGFSPILGIDVMRALGAHIDVPSKNLLLPCKSLKLGKIRLFTNFHIQPKRG